MKLLKKCYVFLSLAICIITIFSGCSYKTNQSKLSETMKGKPVITWGIVRYNPYIENINPNSEIVKFLEDKFHCIINFQYYEKMDIRILRDILSGNNKPDILTMQSLSSEGLYLCSNNYVIPALEIISEENNIIPDKSWSVLSEDGNSLYGIPGRFYTNKQIKNHYSKHTKGIYVAYPYYDLMGKPSIYDMNSILSISKQFIEKYPQLQKQLMPQSDETCIPVVLGNSGTGIETLKLLFGIYPIYKKNNNVQLGITSENWNNLILWLFNLNKFCNKSMSYPIKSLKKILNGKNLFYIGPSDCVESFNASSSCIKYRIIPQIDLNVYGESNPYGNCQTYILKSCKSFSETKKLIQYLLSEEGNSVVKYGIKCKHWIRTDNSTIQLEWAIDQIKSNSQNFIYKTGIGQLLFLSNQESDNPYTPDVLNSYNNVFSSCVLNYKEDSPDSIKLLKLSNYQNSLCESIASVNSINQPIQKNNINIMKQMLQHYSTQFTISSLNERYELYSKMIDKDFIPK